ncbi:uncharacterized protein LOC105699387 isoform X2 [Orussus abietinus]|uniref:uncharacterized protein LOC105699387 isoform X2 n=1 Tax=Orussus abietinus TaxID=222816 RepID=UPI000625D590|nr:uncharacterized protein LOC105699387 isoform X2 [Orussus abietinus]
MENTDIHILPGEASCDDENRKVEKLKEIFLLLKKKLSRSHDLIQLYNDKLKECAVLNADLTLLKNEHAKVKREYNLVLKKVIGLQIQNEDYKKELEAMKKTISQHESKIAGDQRHMQQLLCKLEDIEEKHSEQRMESDLEKSLLLTKVQDLEKEIKSIRKSHGAEKKKLDKMNNDKTIKGSEKDSVNNGHEPVKPVAESKSLVDKGTLTEMYQSLKVNKSVLTDEFYSIKDDPYPLFCAKCEDNLGSSAVEKIHKVMTMCPLPVEQILSPPRPKQQKRQSSTSNDITTIGSLFTSRVENEQSEDVTNKMEDDIAPNSMKDSVKDFKEGLTSNLESRLKDMLSTEVRTVLQEEMKNLLEKYLDNKPKDDGTIKSEESIKNSSDTSSGNSENRDSSVIDALQQRIKSLERKMKKKQFNHDQGFENHCNHATSSTRHSNGLESLQTDLMINLLKKATGLDTGTRRQSALKVCKRRRKGNSKCNLKSISLKRKKKLRAFPNVCASNNWFVEPVKSSCTLEQSVDSFSHVKLQRECRTLVKQQKERRDISKACASFHQENPEIMEVPSKEDLTSENENGFIDETTCNEQELPFTNDDVKKCCDDPTRCDIKDNVQTSSCTDNGASGFLNDAPACKREDDASFEPRIAEDFSNQSPLSPDLSEGPRLKENLDSELEGTCNVVIHESIYKETDYTRDKPETANPLEHPTERIHSVDLPSESTNNSRLEGNEIIETEIDNSGSSPGSPVGEDDKENPGNRFSDNLQNDEKELEKEGLTVDSVSTTSVRMEPEAGSPISPPKVTSRPGFSNFAHKLPSLERILRPRASKNEEIGQGNDDGAKGNAGKGVSLRECELSLNADYPLSPENLRDYGDRAREISEDTSGRKRKRREEDDENSLFVSRLGDEGNSDDSSNSDGDTDISADDSELIMDIDTNSERFEGNVVLAKERFISEETAKSVKGIRFVRSTGSPESLNRSGKIGPTGCKDRGKFTNAGRASKVSRLSSDDEGISITEVHSGGWAKNVELVPEELFQPDYTPDEVQLVVGTEKNSSVAATESLRNSKASGKTDHVTKLETKRKKFFTLFDDYSALETNIDGKNGKDGQNENSEDESTSSSLPEDWDRNRDRNRDRCGVSADEKSKDLSEIQRSRNSLPNGSTVGFVEKSEERKWKRTARENTKLSRSFEVDDVPRPIAKKNFTNVKLERSSASIATSKRDVGSKEESFEEDFSRDKGDPRASGHEINASREEKAGIDREGETPKGNSNSPLKVDYDRHEPIELLRQNIQKRLDPLRTKTKSKKAKQARKAKLEKLTSKETFANFQLNRLLEDSEWSSAILLDVVHQLSRSCKPRVIGKSVIEVLCKEGPKEEPLDRTHTPPAPLMTKTEQRIVAFLVTLENTRFPIIELVQMGIEYKIFRLNCTPMFVVVESLTRMYAVLCRIQKDREKVRMLCCDALYCLGVKALPLMYVVFTSWPEVFPMADTSKEILPKCIVYSIMTSQEGSQLIKLAPLKRMISVYYKYEPSKHRASDMLVELMSSLKEEYRNGLNTALILLAKHEGTDWTYKNVVRGGLLQMIVTREHPSMYDAFCLLGYILRSFPVKDAEKRVADIIEQLCDLLESGQGKPITIISFHLGGGKSGDNVGSLSSTGSSDEQEGIASALLCLSRHRFEKAIGSVLKWKPSRKLYPTTLRQLESLFTARSPSGWQKVIKTINLVK